MADKQTSVKCDGAPVVNVVETHGKPWLPQNAIEADDPQVSSIFVAELILESNAYTNGNMGQEPTGSYRQYA